MANNCIPQSGEIDQPSKFINIKKAIRFNYTWIVSNFKSDRMNSFESPIFSNEMDSEIKWRLKISKDNNSIWNKNYHGNLCKNRCSVQLHVESSDANKIQADLQIQILSSTPSETICCEKSFQFTIGTYTDCFNTRVNDTILDALGYDIILTCQINVKEISKELSIPKCTIYENLDPIFENSKFSDVILCASGKEFKAHKVILASRSSVFSAIFNHDMKEKKYNRVEITDMDGEVLGELLRFIYTGKVFNLKKFANDLLPVAEKYEFENLKVLCGKTLCTNISIENATDVLVLTDIYGLDQLKPVAIGFIGAHVADVIKTAGWKLMTESRPNLITEILCDVAEQLHGNIVPKDLK